MIVPLPQTYRCREGAPLLLRVDTDIFSKRYFTSCLDCHFCHDSCCAYGADVDVENVGRIDAAAGALEAYTEVPRSRWFTGEYREDGEFPGGRFTRTQVVDGACTFRNRAGRGCLIHGFSMARGLDYHALKPMVCSLFPLTFDDGLLRPSNEIRDGSLVCRDTGPTLYRGVRDEVRHYFGDGLLVELDRFEALTR